MSKLVENERIKLTATWFNTLATAVFTVGGFGPIVSYGFGLVPATIQAGFVVGSAVTCLVIATSIHAVARQLLRGLVE